MNSATSTETLRSSDAANGDRGDELATYPRGRWRLVGPEALDRTITWVSHILIRHAGSPGSNACFGPPGWNIYPAPHRTRQQALLLAQQIAMALRGSPERFTELAARHSDDIPTRNFSGSLGGVNAIDLLATPNILDALAVLKPNEISRVVETRCGFHVIRRDPPLPDQMVSGSHIVIGHRDARWLRRFGSDSPAPDRSREEAIELANRIHSLLRDHPEKFEEFVREYSEYRDANQGGDLGEWSTREVPRMARQVDILTRLAVGEIAEPAETIYGVEVLMRTRNRARKRYAMESIQVMFDGAASMGSPSSRDTAWITAVGIAESLASDRSQFPSIQQTYCCPGSEAWTQGRGSAELERRLDELGPGEIMRQPVQQHSAFVVARAIEAPSSSTAPRVSLTLPAPAAPDIRNLVERFSSAAVQRLMREASEETSARLPLPERVAIEFKRMHDLGPSFHQASSPRQRSDMFMIVLRRIESRLTSTQAAFYRTALDEAFERLVLSSTPTSRRSDDDR